MAKAKFIALTSFDLGHRIIAAGDTLFTMEAPLEADLHFFRARLGWSAFRVVVEEDAPAPAADAAPAESASAADQAPPADDGAAGSAPAADAAPKGKKKA